MIVRRILNPNNPEDHLGHQIKDAEEAGAVFAECCRMFPANDATEYGEPFYSERDRGWYVECVGLGLIDGHDAQ